MTTATASARGRANRNKGATAERDLVRWLRTNGWPGAERAVRTGYRTTTRTSADPGDVTGTPGLAWQVKNRADFEQDAVFDACLAETEAQRAATGADFGLLIQRRAGTPDPGRWWVWLRVVDLYRIIRKAPGADVRQRGAFLGQPPLRMELAGLALLLRAAGYGSAPDEPEVA